MTIESDKGEKISSLMDGELNGEHCESLISTICKDEDLKSCLARYQMISDSMKNQLPDGIKKDFVHCVMTAIESEPTTLAPPSSKRFPDKSHQSSGNNIVHFPSITRKVAGFAIAASVATIAIIGVQSQNQDTAPQVASMPQNSEFVRLQTQNPTPVTANAGTFAIPQSKLPQGTKEVATVSIPLNQQTIPQLRPSRKFDPVLQQYIVNHAQYSSGSGVNDIFSHARIVASTQNKLNTDQAQR